MFTIVVAHRCGDMWPSPALAATSACISTTHVAGGVQQLSWPGCGTESTWGVCVVLILGDACVKVFGAMNLLAKDIARVATGVGIVAVECGANAAVRLKGLSSLAVWTREGVARVGGVASSKLWGVSKIAMDASNGVESRGGRTSTEDQRSGAGGAGSGVPQPEDLFAPQKAAESRLVQSVDASTARVEPVSQKVALPSVSDAHSPTT